ncbi:MAG: CPBP family intramembrane metalloprotease [Bacteroidales bacterium]|nr:CPBP family intramembrane metalloprotease [Bacteroidales bacterium]
MNLKLEKKETQSNITPILWAGVILWISSLLILSILGIFGYGFEQDVLRGMFGSISPWLVFLVGGIVGPIWEEFAFRYWTVGKLSARITSFCLILIFVYLESGNILFTIGVAVLLFVLMFLIKKNEIALIISTSAIFSLIHITGFSSLSIMAVIGLIEIFSMAVVMCCLALKYRFVIAIAVHIINNIIALSTSEESGKRFIDNQHNYNITAITNSGENTIAIKPINGKDVNMIELTDSTETIISFQGSMSEFIDMMYRMDTNHTITTLYRMNKEDEKLMPDYSFVLKLCDTNATNCNDILCRTMKLGVFLKQDTLYETVYCLTLKDSAIFNNRQTDCEYPKTINDFVMEMQYFFDLPIIIDENIDKNQKVCINLFDIKNIDFFNAVYGKLLGVELLKTDAKIPVIEFRKQKANY